MSRTLEQTLGSGPAEGLNGSFFGITHNPVKEDKITDFIAPGTFTPDPLNTAGDVEIALWGGGGGGGRGIAGVCFGGGGGSGQANLGSTITTTMATPQSVTIGSGGGSESSGSPTSIGAYTENGGNGAGSSCGGAGNGDYSGGSGPAPGFRAGGGAGSTSNGFPAGDGTFPGKGGSGIDVTPFGVTNPSAGYTFAGGGGGGGGGPTGTPSGSNTGVGGGGGGEGGGSPGFSGRVLVKEAGYGPVTNSYGVWSLQAQYTYKKAGNWT